LARGAAADRVAVLGEGRVLEYGPPAALLQDPASAFRALVDANAAPGAPPHPREEGPVTTIPDRWGGGADPPCVVGWLQKKYILK